MEVATKQKELETAAAEAIYGLQLPRSKAIKFVLKNVGNEYIITNDEAANAVEQILVPYK